MKKSPKVDREEKSGKRAKLILYKERVGCSLFYE